MTFPIRGILKLTATLLRRSWLPLTLVTLCLYLVPAWGIKFVQTLAFHSSWRGAFISDHGFGPAAWTLIVISWLLHGFHMSAVTEIALRAAASKPIRPRQLLLNAAVNAVPVLVTQFLLEVILVTGGILLVVPGLYLGAAFSVVVPTYVCEGKNIPQAFRQSFKLTKHRHLPIAGIWLVIFLIYGWASGSLLSIASLIEANVQRLFPALSLPLLSLPEPMWPFFSTPVGMALSTLVHQGIYVTLMVLNVAIYLGLRFHKTDSADNEVAAIFE